uniref:Phosphoglycerate mutase n=1 Tax=viral metagenome TaxID=1070528 RepID=A0A6C0C4R1_9ZZZZ
MKIIILRHGDRFDSPLYFTPLTLKGLTQASKLADELTSYNIDIIYSSPFLRTLQTVYPFCIKTNKKINIENAFYECLSSEEFNYHNYRHFPQELQLSHPHLLSIINNNYHTKLLVSNISYTETHQQIKNRVFPFIYNLCQQHKHRNTTILIVTHATIANAIKIFFNHEVKFDDHVPTAKPIIIDVPVNINGPA